MDVARAASTMEGVTVARPMTAEEYLATGDEERRTQLIDGEVLVNEPGWRHERVIGHIQFALESWVRAKSGRGAVSRPIDVLVDEYNVFAPDLVWYAEGRVPAGDAPRPYALPDLAVEVRSPSTWRMDIGRKKGLYEARGLPELWLVDTAADAVLVFRRSRADAPGFDVALELARGEGLPRPSFPGSHSLSTSSSRSDPSGADGQ
jgi:Uma2 family endonuclease